VEQSRSEQGLHGAHQPRHRQKGHALSGGAGCHRINRFRIPSGLSSMVFAQIVEVSTDIGKARAVLYGPCRQNGVGMRAFGPDRSGQAAATRIVRPEGCLESQFFNIHTLVSGGHERCFLKHENRGCATRLNNLIK